MRKRQPANIPAALSAARGQFDQWRSGHRKRARLPKELWRRAAALAREHGLNKTARALGLKYYSLKKHLDEMTAEEVIPAKAKPDFIELLGGVMTPGSTECIIEWSDGRRVQRPPSDLRPTSLRFCSPAVIRQPPEGLPLGVGWMAVHEQKVVHTTS